MGKTGTQVKFNTLKQQREAAELELIIEEFGNAMRNADKTYVSKAGNIAISIGLRFTPNMNAAWTRYMTFCMEHSQ
jgi:hypothetical protein